MNDESKILAGLGGVVLFFVALNLIIGGYCTQYVIEFWATFIRHTPVHVKFFPCAVVGLFFGEFFIPACICTWLLSFAIGG